MHDPLVHILRPHDLSDNPFAPTTWTEKAYTNTFQKYTYAPGTDFVKEDPELTRFCDQAVLTEYSYCQGSQIIPIYETDKNQDSTPSYPKFLAYETEEEYLDTCGFTEHRHLVNEHPLDKRPIWWTFLKNEVIKRKKIKEDDIRIITCTDPVVVRLGLCFDQDFNNRTKAYTETRHAQCGWTPFFGGLHRRIRRLESEGRTAWVELDWTRFDGTIKPDLLLRVREMRYFLIDDRCKSQRSRDLWDWYNYNLLHRLTLLPTGELTEIHTGNPSGQPSTTVDNNLVNEFLTAWEFATLFREQHGRLPTVSEYRKNVDFVCYGDDRLLCFNPNWVKYDMERVIRLYKEVFGMWVKPENLKVSHSAEGLGFCGMTLHQVRGQWIGIPNIEKLVAALYTPARALPGVEALWGKLVSYRLLCEHAAPEVRELLEVNIARVEEYCERSGIALPKVGPDFYQRLW